MDGSLEGWEHRIMLFLLHIIHISYSHSHFLYHTSLPNAIQYTSSEDEYGELAIMLF